MGQKAILILVIAIGLDNQLLEASHSLDGSEERRFDNLVSVYGGDREEYHLERVT